MGKRQIMLSVRVSAEEKAKVKSLAAELRKANRYLTEADVLRELIGFEDTGLITPAMRKRLRADPPIPARVLIPQGRAYPHIPLEKKGGQK